MTVKALMTADVGNTSQWTSITGTRNTTYFRTGSSCFQLNAGGTHVRNIAAGVTNYVRVPWLTALANNGFLLKFREGTTVHAVVSIDAATNTIEGLRNTTSLGTAAYVFPPLETWLCIEVKATIDNSAGEITVKINGVQVLNLTSKDTNNAGAIGTCDNIAIVPTLNGYFDDICIRDDAWPGQHGIYVKVPTAESALTDWTASTGTKVACVNETPPEYATDYLYADGGTAGLREDFTITALGFTPSSMGAIGVLTNAKLHAAGSGKIRSFAISNGQESDGADVTLSTSAQWVEDYMAVDPDGGGAWAVAKADALLVGVETRA